MSPVLPAGDFRIVLNWGANPRDLDSHLRGPCASEVMYNNKVCQAGQLKATLDRDATQGYGPETITIKGGSATSSAMQLCHSWETFCIFKGT